MSTTSTSQSAQVPSSEQPAVRRGRGGLGSFRSLIISMIVIMAAVLAWVAMVPRVSEISQPAVDVTTVAMQVRRDTGWAISQPQLPAGWKATSVRFESSANGVRTWHAGYLSPDGHYVSIEQTTVPAGSNSWISSHTSNGRPDGTLSAAGTTWLKLSSSQTVQRSLVVRGSGAAGLTTVVSGTAPYAQLAQFAGLLKPVPMPKA